MSQEQIAALTQQIAELSKGLEGVNLSSEGSAGALVADLSSLPGLQGLVEEAASAAIGRERTRMKEMESELTKKQEELRVLQGAQENSMDAKEIQDLLQKQQEAMAAQFAAQLAPVQQQLQASQTQLVRERVLRNAKIPKDFEQYVSQTGTADEMAASAAKVRSLYEKIQSDARSKALSEYGVDTSMSAAEYAAHLESLKKPEPEPQTVSIEGKTFDLGTLDVPEELKTFLKAQADLSPEAHGVAPAPQTLPQSQPTSTTPQLGYNQNSQQGMQPQQPAQTQTPLAANAPEGFGQQAPVGDPASTLNVGATSTQDYLSTDGLREQAHAKMRQALANI